jgi:hypothetical protein
MAKNTSEVVIRLSGISLTAAQRTSLAAALKGTAVQVLGAGAKDALLVRPSVVSAKNITIEIARVLADGGM